jgi:hypothetical protein
MIVRIKYENPSQHGEYVIEELDDTIVNVPEYCTNLHKNHLCIPNQCDGVHCKIWVEINGVFMLAGIMD